MLWWIRGRSSILGGCVTAISGIVLTTGTFVNLGLADGWWQPLSPVPIMSGVVSALIAALFLPAWRARLIGGIAVVAVVAILTVPPSIGAAERRTEADAAADAASNAALERQVADSTLPFVTQLPGSSVWDVQPSDYVSIAYIVSADGGALRIDTVGESADTGRDALGCWMLVGDLGVFDETVTMNHYAGVCDEVAPGRWQQADGSGIAVVHEGVLVLLTSVDQESAEMIGATRPATTSELSDAADHLRLVSRDELRTFLLNARVDAG